MKKFTKVTLIMSALVVLLGTLTAFAGGGQGNPSSNGWTPVIAFEDEYDIPSPADAVDYMVVGNGTWTTLINASKNFAILKVAMYGFEDSNSATIFTCQTIHIGMTSFSCSSVPVSIVTSPKNQTSYVRITKSYYMTLSLKPVVAGKTYLDVKVYDIQAKDGVSTASVTEIANTLPGYIFYIYSAKQ